MWSEKQVFPVVKDTVQDRDYYGQKINLMVLLSKIDRGYDGKKECLIVFPVPIDDRGDCGLREPRGFNCLYSMIEASMEP